MWYVTSQDTFKAQFLSGKYSGTYDIHQGHKTGNRNKKILYDVMHSNHMLDKRIIMPSELHFFSSWRHYFYG